MNNTISHNAKSVKSKSANINEVKECVSNLLSKEIERIQNSTDEVDQLNCLGLFIMKNKMMDRLFNFYVQNGKNGDEENINFAQLSFLFGMWYRLYLEDVSGESVEETYDWIDREYENWVNEPITDNQMSVQNFVENLIYHFCRMIRDAIFICNKNKRIYDPYYNVVVEYVACVFGDRNPKFNECGKEYVKDYCYELMIDNKDIYQNAVKGDEDSIHKLTEILISFFIDRHIGDPIECLFSGYETARGDVDILLNTDKFLQNNPDLIEMYNKNKTVSPITYKKVMMN